MEEANSRVQKAVDELINEVDKSCLRKMQVEMFRCSARCCENNDISIHQVQQCVSRCNAPAEQADQYLQSEMQGFQSRLQRCAMDCRDKANDALGPKSSEKERQQASSAMEKCVIKCTDTHLALLPTMLKRVKDTLSQQHKS